jgi:hypothetical protein
MTQFSPILKHACCLTIAMVAFVICNHLPLVEAPPEQKTLNPNNFFAHLNRRNLVSRPGFYSRLFVHLAGTLLSVSDAANIR